MFFFYLSPSLSLSPSSLSFSGSLISSGVEENCLLGPNAKSTKCYSCFSLHLSLTFLSPCIDVVNKSWRHPAVCKETCLFSVAFSALS